MMTTITQLVTLHTELTKLQTKLSFQQEISDNIRLVEYLRDNHVESQLTETIVESCQLALSYDNKIQQDFSQAISTIENKIDDLILANSTKSYFQYDIIPNNVNTDMDTELEKIITTKINSYSNWKYPGMLVNIKNKKYIDMMIVSDPLYIVYTDQPMIDQILESYTAIYQRRLRLYNIVDITRDMEFNHSLAAYQKKIYPFDEQFVDTTKEQKFSPVAYALLPTNQFGLILCWDTFNFIGSKKIELYIKIMFDLLRPGGTFVFNYNNCDLLGSALRAEKDEMSYCNQRILKKFGEAIGYETKFTDFAIKDSIDSHISLAEFTKPGLLQTSKAQQVLGEIIEN